MPSLSTRTAPGSTSSVTQPAGGVRGVGEGEASGVGDGPPPATKKSAPVPSATSAAAATRRVAVHLRVTSWRLGGGGAAGSGAPARGPS